MTKANLRTETSVQIEQLPPWMTAIRTAVCGAIQADDLKEIFAKQVELAKQGDRRAAKFILEQARAFSDLRGLTLIQNVYHGGDGTPSSSEASLPASPPPPPGAGAEQRPRGNGEVRVNPGKRSNAW